MDEEISSVPEGEQDESTGQSAAEQMIRLGEEEVPLTKVGEVWKNYQNDTKWQARNTQMSQRLKAEESRIEKARILEDYLSKNPDKYGAIEAIIKGGQQGQVQPGSVPPVDMSQITSARQEIGAMVEEIKVAREIDGLKGQYPEFFKEPGFEGRLIQHCLDNNIPNLAWALKDMTYDKRLEMGLNKGQEKVELAKKNSQKMGAPVGSKGGVSVGSKELKSKGYKELADTIANDPSIPWDS